MVRLMLVLATIACIFLGIALSKAFSILTQLAKHQHPALLGHSLPEKIDGLAINSNVGKNVSKAQSRDSISEKGEEPSKKKASKRNKKKEKVIEKEPHKKLLILPLEASAIGILLLVILDSFYVIHCVWAVAKDYLAPSIVLTSQSHDGLHVFDDFLEAYAWLRQNTNDDDKVASWWDYSYQTTEMTNRTVIVDNNTWNNIHITIVSTTMSSSERQA